jgi:diguanylate cyclase (GGDEF)-like protein/putative nucleotidyltransferase with HDIG domain
MSAVPAATRRPPHLRIVPPGARDGAQGAAELIAHAQAEERHGRRGAARAAYEQALYRLADEGEAREYAPSLVRWVARTFQMEADAEAALDCVEAALAVAEAWGDEAAAGHALNLQAVVHWQTGGLDAAERLFLQARARALGAGDAKLAAMTAQNLGVLANTRGDFEEAHRHYSAALAEYRALGLTRDVAYALNNLGLLHTARRDWKEAERALVEATQICDLTGDVTTRIALDVNLAELWVAQGEFGRAQQAVGRALEGAGRTGDTAVVGQATKLLGITAREAGDFAAAEEHFVRADEVATARQDLLLQAEIARERADLARRLGKNRDVLQQLNRSHRLFSQLRARAELADVGRRLGGLEEQFILVARRWGESIEAKDRYTQGHCQRVADLSCLVAERAGVAHGFDTQAMFWFRIGALLHDVGKLVIPPEVLNKPGKLTDEEWALMRSHTTAGVETLADVEFPWDVRPIIESHHERWDGNGYPHQLAGEAIPLTARILCVADVYDALTSVRSYKRALTHDEAMAIMRRDVGKMFDPGVFAWFEQVADEWAARAAVAPPEPAEAPAADAPPPERPSGDALDDLTGLPLRRAFRDTAERILAARRTTGRPVSLLVIDVDHFKLVNDTFGHLQGDDVLRVVADQIRAHTRPSDYPARYAGDEFVVLLPGTRLDEARAVAERLRAAVARTACPRRDGSGVAVHVTLSIGVAAAPQHGDGLEPLFAAADAALYDAKRAGRNAVSARTGGAGRTPELMLECFVGRAAERQRLRTLLEEAAQGKPHVLAVCGEAGVGKSTLVKQMAPDVGIRSGSLLIGRCVEADVRPPYAPWVDVVHGMVRAGIAPDRPWRELGRLVPELAHGGAAPASDGGSQHALLEELRTFLTLAAEQRPLVVVLDDMQWADVPSWDALDYLVSRLSTQRLLVFLTIRAEDLDERGDSRRGRVSRAECYGELALARLSEQDLAQWLRTALGGQEPEPALLAYLVAQSEGNPLFALQTLRTLVEDGRLCAADGRWTFDGADDAAMPRAIHDLLARRVARLDRAHRDVLTVAAVLGREFDPETLVASCEGGEGTVLDALDAGLAAAVLVPSEVSDTGLAFAHALLTRVLQSGINPLRLRRIHERVGRALESRGGSLPAEVALHFDRAGCAADAFRTAMDAGARAGDLYAYESRRVFEMARRHAASCRRWPDVEWRVAQIAEIRGRYPDAERACDAVLTAYAAGRRAGVLRSARACASA